MKKGSNTMDRMSALSAMFLALALGACSYDTDKFSQPDNGGGGDAGDDAAAPVTCDDGVVDGDTDLHLFIRKASLYSGHDAWVFTANGTDSDLSLISIERFRGQDLGDNKGADDLEIFIPRGLADGPNRVRVFFDLNDNETFPAVGEANTPEAPGWEPMWEFRPCSDGTAELDAQNTETTGALDDPMMKTLAGKFTARFTLFHAAHNPNKTMEVRVYDTATNRVVAVDHLPVVQNDDFTLEFRGVVAEGGEYRVDFIAEKSNPDTLSIDKDHNWSRTVTAAKNDLDEIEAHLEFEHTTPFDLDMWEYPAD